MIYVPEENAILPEATGDPNKMPTLVDLNVLKKGGFNQFSTKSKAA